MPLSDFTSAITSHRRSSVNSPSSIGLCSPPSCSPDTRPPASRLPCARPSVPRPRVPDVIRILLRVVARITLAVDKLVLLLFRGVGHADIRPRPLAIRSLRWCPRRDAACLKPTFKPLLQILQFHPPRNLPLRRSLIRRPLVPVGKPEGRFATGSAPATPSPSLHLQPPPPWLAAF